MFSFLAPLLNLDYYLIAEPISPPFDIIFWVITGIFMVLGGISLWQERKTKKRMWENMSVATASFFVAGLFLNFFPARSAPFFGWRLWLVIWLVSIFIWVGFKAHYFLIARPRAKNRVQEILGKKKYLA